MSLTGVSTSIPTTSSKQLARTPETSQMSNEVTHLMLNAIGENTSSLGEAFKETKKSYQKNNEEHKATIIRLMEALNMTQKALAESNANFAAQEQIHQEELKIRDEKLATLKQKIDEVAPLLNQRATRISQRVSQQELLHDAKVMQAEIEASGNCTITYKHYRGTPTQIYNKIDSQLNQESKDFLAGKNKGLNAKTAIDLAEIKTNLTELQQIAKIT